MSRAQHTTERSEFLSGIRGKHLLEVLRAASHSEVRAGQILLREGASASRLFLLQSGHVKLYRLSDRGDEIRLADFSPGDVFGLYNLLARPGSYVATAETTCESEFLVWERTRLLRLAQKYPRLSQNALSIVLRYLAEYFDRLFHLVSSTAAERLAHVVLRLGKETGALLPAGVEITATNEELATQANLSVFTVSRLLNTWVRAGALKKSRNKVFVKSPEKLIRG